MKDLIKMNLIRNLTVLALVLVSAMPASLCAQRSYDDVGIGFQVGQPTGLSLKFYNPRLSWDVLAAWDLDDFLFINIHGLRDKSLNDRHTIHLFYGPGVFVGVRDGSKFSDDVALGISGSLGIDFLFDKLELFAQITPRFELVESTSFDMGGGVGMRFYF